MSSSTNNTDKDKNSVTPPTYYSTSKGEKANDGVCFICADHPKLWTISECNHRVCYICILRLRCLYQTKSCPICKTESPKTLITTSADGMFSDLFKGEKFFVKDEESGLWFETEKIKAEVLKAIKINCPFQKCNASFKSKGDLKKHVSSSHDLYLW